VKLLTREIQKLAFGFGPDHGLSWCRYDFFGGTL